MILLPVFADKLLGEANGVSLAVCYRQRAPSADDRGVGRRGSRWGRFRRHGWLILGGSWSFGCALIVFALAPWFWLLVMMEWVASASNQLFNVNHAGNAARPGPDEFRAG